MLNKDEVLALQKFLKSKRLDVFGEPSGVMCNDTYRAYKLYLQKAGLNPDNYNVSSITHLSDEARNYVRDELYKSSEQKNSSTVTRSIPVAQETTAEVSSVVSDTDEAAKTPGAESSVKKWVQNSTFKKPLSKR